ncbi:DUF1345 domain-containing protein [Paracoccus sp. (in: a-proteobacteria)]|uniref:DUF1345 domain-containing protein n=1 Tax=Paracoccus sp. TaxID=267 RepID=UPI0026DF4736|nr:DUF1345 domain-containing protein [Paracoccus sp. (in: a-proteobacteria)]MDO5648409.1 DUF1345 domain-containing protein [Paracoccus sp. (in: a-proteobacteria)]
MTLTHPRIWLFAAVFLAVTCGALLLTDPARAFVLGFDAGACAFILSLWPLWHRADAARLRVTAARDDSGRALTLTLAVAALGAVMVALGLVLRQSSDGNVVMVVATLVLAWLFGNLICAIHYAHFYYDQRHGDDRRGLQFPDDAPPVFSDFCYFSLAVGMTFQAPDVVICDAALRRFATVHSLVAFAFNIGLLGLSVNVLAGVV